uniref:Uncharacterized protein n=1 Tax=Heterorhabditis bacteriophora TaxID=37862 RepID=A0A1I7WFG2_HETBA
MVSLFFEISRVISAIPTLILANNQNKGRKVKYKCDFLCS